MVLKPKIFGRLRFFLFLLSLFFTLIFINIIRSCASSEYIYIYLFFFLLVKKFEKTKAMITLKHVMFVCFENTKPPIKGVKRFNAEFQFFFFYKTRWVRVFEYAIKGTNCFVVREGIPSSPRVKIFSAWKAINSRVERELQSFSSILTVSSVHKGTSIRSKQSCLFVSYSSSNNL